MPAEGERSICCCVYSRWQPRLDQSAHITMVIAFSLLRPSLAPLAMPAHPWCHAVCYLLGLWHSFPPLLRVVQQIQPSPYPRRDLNFQVAQSGLEFRARCLLRIRGHGKSACTPGVRSGQQSFRMSWSWLGAPSQAGPGAGQACTHGAPAPDVGRPRASSRQANVTVRMASDARLQVRLALHPGTSKSPAA